MRIIEKIEIKYFRSFADNPVKIYNLKDINIFSGSNDSGKSNVLRALNLFFNNEVADGKKFNFDSDFSRIQLLNIENKYKDKKKSKKEDKDIRKTTAFIEIKLHFSISDRSGGSLPKKFWFSRRWTASKPEGEFNNNVESSYRIENKDKISLLASGTKEEKRRLQNTLNSLKAQTTKLFNKFEFHYVPAIKDIYFFKELYSKLQVKLNQQSSDTIKEATQYLQNSIREQTTSLFEKFKKSTGLDARFLFEQQMLDFKKNLEVETGEQNILLTSRGDGIQAKFIPNILEEISKSEKNKYIIWGFEEPENSYEYRNSIDLAQKFYSKYSVNKQIFITTHAREFLSIKDPDETMPVKRKVSIYRVFKDAEGSSKITRYDEQKGFDKEEVKTLFGKGDKTELEYIYNDLGIIDESRTISDLEKTVGNLRLEKERLKQFESQVSILAEKLQNEQSINNHLNDELEKARENQLTIIYCEGKNDIIFNAMGFDKIKFLGGQNKGGVFDSVKNKGVTHPFGIIDKDHLLNSEVQLLEEKTNISVLDRYCIENYLYHPDNLEEFKTKKGLTYNKNRYKAKILAEKNKWRGQMATTYTINTNREKYGPIMAYIKEITRTSMINPPDSIVQDINSAEFDIIYPQLPMKDWKGKFIELQGIEDIKLSETDWFKQKITSKIISFLPRNLTE